MTGTSCQGLTNGKSVGDTILVFAEKFNNNMLGGSLCSRHTKFNELTDLELNFIDTAKWHNPKSLYADPEKHITNCIIQITNQKFGIIRLF